MGFSLILGVSLCIFRLFTTGMDSFGGLNPENPLYTLWCSFTFSYQEHIAYIEGFQVQTPLYTLCGPVSLFATRST